MLCGEQNATAQHGRDAKPRIAQPRQKYRGRSPTLVMRGVYIDGHHVTTLRGIPTIRPFEALACAIPLISAPWDDAEGLFTPGQDFLVARSGIEMRGRLDLIRNDPELGEALSEHGRATIESRHSCAHRVDELLIICRALGRDFCPPQTVAAQ